MKIAFVIPDFGSGGAEKNILLLAQEFSSSGYDVVLITLSSRGVLKLDLSSNINCINLGTGSVSKSLLKMSRVIKDNKVDIVCSTLKHVSIMVEFSRWLSLNKFKHVIRVANTYSHEITKFSPLKKNLIILMLKLTHKYSSHTICVSNGVKNDLLGIVKCSHKLSVIYNPIYDDNLTFMAKQKTNIYRLDEKKGFNVVAAGRLSYQKAFDVLIKAFNSYLHDKDAHLYILGEGDDRIKLNELVNKLRLTDRVTFAGYVENPFAYFAKASVFVLSSRYEGLPNVLIQAMCCGVPLVSTDCESGPKEILDNGKLGLLVPVNNEKKLGKAIRAVAEGNYVITSSDDYKDKYSIFKQVKKYEKVFSMLLKSKSYKPL